MTEPELDLLEAAVAARCHYTTLLRAIRARRLRATKRFGKWRISRSDLARFLAATESPNQSSAESDEVQVG